MERRNRMNQPNLSWLERKGTDRSSLPNIILCATMLFTTCASWAVPVWALITSSDPGDPIGQGMDRSFMQANGGLSTPDLFDITGDGLADYLTFSFVSNDSNTTWNLTFGTSSFVNSNLGSLIPGTYTSAQKAAFADAGHPGLDFSLNGIAASTLTGQFTITDAAFKAKATGFEVERFAATFEQFAEGLSVGLTGDFRFVADGDVVPPVPSPGTAYLCAIGLLSLWSTRRLHTRALPQFRANFLDRGVRIDGLRDILRGHVLSFEGGGEISDEKNAAQ